MSKIKVVRGVNDLATTHPHLIKEWDFEKNKDIISPYEVTYGNSTVVNWKCKHGHTWKSSIHNRTSKGNEHNGCPVCSKKKLVSGINDFATTHPLLLKEWDFEKNKDIILPNELTSGNRKIKVWWKCCRGHSWKATVADRMSGKGCPECNVGTHTSFPEQAVLYYLKKCDNSVKGDVKIGGFQWDIYVPNKNILIEYDGWYYHKNETERSRLRDKWTINNSKKYTVYHIIETNNKNEFRINGNNIYYSQGIEKYLNKSIEVISKIIFGVDIHVDVSKESIEILQRYNPQYIHTILLEDGTEVVSNEEFLERSLGVLYPEISKEWHPTMNGKFTPYDFSAHSKVSVYWQCKNNPKHVYQARISNRTAKKSTGCSFCHGKNTFEGEDFTTLYPDILKYWDYEKNGNLNPKKYKPKSQKYFYWKCPKCGYKWKARIPQLIIAKVCCPECRKNNAEIHKIEREKNKSKKHYLGIDHPELLKEWDFEKNECDPYKTTCGTNAKYWWKCKHGHSWSATIKARLTGRSCPYCNGKYVNIGVNDLATVYPDIAESFDTKKNDTTPDKVFAKSRKKYWWKCPHCGYEWCVSANNRAHKVNHRCPKCKQ